mgnify:CR=1 FL=1
MRLRKSDPPSINKGDPRKFHSYENIEALKLHLEQVDPTDQDLLLSSMDFGDPDIPVYDYGFADNEVAGDGLPTEFLPPVEADPSYMDALLAGYAKGMAEVSVQDLIKKTFTPDL